MAYPTFKPISHPDQAMDRTKAARMRENTFNDGYEQVARVGRFNNLEEISPSWTNANKLEGEYINAFLDERAGLPFYYQPNGQGPIRCYRCTDYTSKQKKGNYYDISAKFKQMPLT